MKKYLVPIFFGGVMLGACFNRPTPDLPVFDLLLSDSSTHFNTGKIPDGQPSVLLFFSPDCEHCQNETSSLLQNMDSLKNVNFYFITIDPMEDMRRFSAVYKLSRYTNIIVGQDYKFFFPRFLKVAIPPSSLIYDQDRRLRAVFKGETNATAIISVINKL